MVPTGGPGGAARERDASERAGERTEALTCGPRYQSQAGACWAGLPAGPRRERRLGRATGLRERGGQAGEREVGRGLGCWVGFLVFFSYFSSKQHSTNLNSNSNLNSNHMHSAKIKPCTSMNAQTCLNLEKI